MPRRSVGCLASVAVAWLTVCVLAVWVWAPTDLGSTSGDADVVQRVRPRGTEQRELPQPSAAPSSSQLPSLSSKLPQQRQPPQDAVGDTLSELSRIIIEVTVTDKRVESGTLRIILLPNVSGPASAEYVATVARLSGGPATATLFRSEPGTLVQGRIDDPRVPQIDARGPCPAGIDASKVKSSYCGCGCNGPIMRRGMVAWAGGFGHGPDFFIFTGDDGQGDAWSHDHTVWGTLADDESFATMDRIYKLPTVRQGVTMIADEKGITSPLSFTTSVRVL